MIEKGLAEKIYKIRNQIVTVLEDLLKKDGYINGNFIEVNPNVGEIEVSYKLNNLEITFSLEQVIPLLIKYDRLEKRSIEDYILLDYYLGKGTIREDLLKGYAKITYKSCKRIEEIYKMLRQGIPEHSSISDLYRKLKDKLDVSLGTFRKYIKILEEIGAIKTKKTKNRRIILEVYNMNVLERLLEKKIEEKLGSNNLYIERSVYEIMKIYSLISATSTQGLFVEEVNQYILTIEGKKNVYVVGITYLPYITGNPRLLFKYRWFVSQPPLEDNINNFLFGRSQPRVNNNNKPLQSFHSHPKGVTFFSKPDVSFKNVFWLMMVGCYSLRLNGIELEDIPTITYKDLREILESLERKGKELDEPFKRLLKILREKDDKELEAPVKNEYFTKISEEISKRYNVVIVVEVIGQNRRIIYGDKEKITKDIFGDEIVIRKKAENVLMLDDIKVKLNNFSYNSRTFCWSDGLSFSLVAGKFNQGETIKVFRNIKIFGYLSRKDVEKVLEEAPLIVKYRLQTIKVNGKTLKKFIYYLLDKHKEIPDFIKMEDIFGVKNLKVDDPVTCYIGKVEEDRDFLKKVCIEFLNRFSNLVKNERIKKICSNPKDELEKIVNSDEYWGAFKNVVDIFRYSISYIFDSFRKSKSTKEIEEILRIFEEFSVITKNFKNIVLEEIRNFLLQNSN